jgi:hypothetical protein
MKKMLAAISLTLALAFVAPALGAGVTKSKTKAECERAGGTWDAQAHTCSKKM